MIIEFLQQIQVVRSVIAYKDILKYCKFAKLVIILGWQNYFIFFIFYFSSRANGDLNSCSVPNDPAKCTTCDNDKKRVQIGGNPG